MKRSMVRLWSSRSVLRWCVLPSPPPPGSPLVDAAGLRVVRGGTAVVDGVDLTVAAGELVALVGPNGAGKSSVLGAVAGDLRPAAGRLAVAGGPVGSWTAAELAQRRAVVPQRVTVSFPFTARQVIAMGRSPWAGTPAEDDDDEAVAAAAEATDVDHLLERHVPSLSGGEQARVALARALAQRTVLLLLDEPTAALDLHHQALVLGAVRRRVDGGAGALVVLHDLTAAAAWADRVVLLDRGRVAAVGRPVEVCRPEVLGPVYRHQVAVVAGPEPGSLVVVPSRFSM